MVKFRIHRCQSFVNTGVFEMKLKIDILHFINDIINKTVGIDCFSRIVNFNHYLQISIVYSDDIGSDDPP